MTATLYDFDSTLLTQATMDKQDDWNALLQDHPIFFTPKSVSRSGGKSEASLELSLSSLPDFTDVDPMNDRPTPSGRRRAMVVKDSDIVIAVGSEICMAALGDVKLSKGARKSYKILHTPNLQFDVHQMVLNPNSKLLAVAGAFQVAVIVLPRAGFTKLVPTTVDCKSIQIGQFYHAADTSVPIAKIDWHPWGEGGSTLMVMTIDGKLREYDISIDAEEPQQVLSFVPEKRKSSFSAGDESEREVASFTLGKGRADWGPLSIYAVMKSGDIYAISPYMPKNASLPSSYVHALECFVAAKQEFLFKSQDEGSSSTLSTLYDYQHKYVNALLKQLPPGTAFPAVSRSIPMRPPNTVRNPPVRQGPFLLQPSPRSLEGSEGGDATDILYLAFERDVEDGAGSETERLAVLLITFQDGRVDVCLDVEKVEARWEHQQPPDSDLPMLAVYETIDLGIISTLSKVTVAKSEPPILELIQGNHPVFLLDPIHDETIYVYHAFGVHALQLGPMLRSLAVALRNDADNGDDAGSLEEVLHNCNGADVQPLLSTFSVERRCSNPIVGVSIPNDVYLTYSIFILTSVMRMTVLPLNLRPDSPYSVTSDLPSISEKSPPPKSPATPDEPPAYVSLLGSESYVPPPIFSRPSSNPRLSLPPSSDLKSEFMLTPDTLRFLGTAVERFESQIHEVQLARRAAEARAELQEQEFARQRAKCQEMFDMMSRSKGLRRVATKEKVIKLQHTQKMLMTRLDRVLQSLMEKASPELSDHETKWFEELRRMKEEVVGSSKYDNRSLAARTKLVCDASHALAVFCLSNWLLTATQLHREMERLLPDLKEMKERERKRRLAESQESLGVSQAFELGKLSNEEGVRIGDIEKEILKLADRLDVTLGRPPSLQDQQ
ncbi:hypothetical protein AcV7_008361 [Taiwanofungus camphoratus]|nr:hypothetical protein AcV7_008361 [Antrodia cinnamomea]